MMKKIIKYILIVLMLSAQFSCNKFMDILPPDGLVKNQYWNTKEEVEQVLLGAYSTFAQLDGQMFKYGEMRADMVTDLSNIDGDDRKVMQVNIYPDNSLCNWYSFYKVINYCNEVIKNAPVVRTKDNTFTDFQLDEFLAEAYFLRSLSYFYLVRVFKDVPFVQEASETDDADFYVPKTDGDTILNHITTDLENYRNYAVFSVNGTTDGRVTKGAFDALLADIALWQFRYADCIKHVENIENSEKYFLLPAADWFEMFYPGNSLESIFEFQYITNLEDNHMYGLTVPGSDGNKYGPSEKAVDFFNVLADQVESIRGEGKSISKDNLSIWKYIGAGVFTRPGFSQKSCGWIVYRYADVLLMKAEALSQLERYTEAMDLLVLIRKRAGFVNAINIANTPGAYEEEILEERARELAFEGKRWFDLMRMGRRNTFSNAAKLVNIIVQNAPSAEKRILATKLINPLGWYLPIAKDELERNMNLVQNPYYK
jgi:hypothetical protein